MSMSSKPACFWCSYDFDNLPIHIPKYILNGLLLRIWKFL